MEQHLNRLETEHAIKLVKDTFQLNLATSLKLRRITAPLFVESGKGLNDDLAGQCNAINFYIRDLNTHAEIVQSLAKWKRVQLAELNFNPGYGIYTDMNAIRPDEILDDIHSLYVDQWDWEQVITKQDRTLEYLENTVKKIYYSLLRTEYIVCENYSNLIPFLPEKIHFITSEALRKKYSIFSPKERENKIAKEYGAVFIEGIGGKLDDGTIHDTRADDYDDWSTISGVECDNVDYYNTYGLNGDLLVWYEPLQKAIEISSMGIRVDQTSLMKQLEVSGNTYKKDLYYHKLVLENKLPLTIGGGIGQSRLCMILLHKMHIGEIQASIWPDEMIEKYKKIGINLIH